MIILEENLMKVGGCWTGRVGGLIQQEFGDWLSFGSKSRHWSFSHPHTPIMQHCSAHRKCCTHHQSTIPRCSVLISVSGGNRLCGVDAACVFAGNWQILNCA